MQNLFDRWMQWPLAARIASGISIFLIAVSMGGIFDEYDPFEAFVENLVAAILHYGVGIGGMCAGIWIGILVGSRPGRAWTFAGWATGIFLVGASTLLSDEAGRALNISDRMDRLSQSDCTTEWDGRSNPAYCD
ncbi:hypothetical protein LAZ40_01510 [Cereibacter sphaeroides]|uniref:hypothetical protein n=1 Tax=Cereibacter sphaeroides TaxID=1063 RepID=UPI001F2BDF1F|nr:hypothetical protein [Cereibacter sphaeroides]MCE6957737.1 hypothetical protein [Cereibacter sphaeroides]MCE6971523.1 hypothetical protein [Cereibacter sphaeroides]